MLPESRFYRAVREFALTNPVWGDAIRYQSLPDERWDLTLVAERVYGDRGEFLAVMAAAGLDRLDQELTERELVLPTKQRLALIRDSTGYVKQATTSVR